jgi:hypothetical protein
VIEEERNMTYDDDIVRSSRNITPSEQPNQPDMLSEINTNDGTFEIYQEENSSITTNNSKAANDERDKIRRLIRE